MRAALCLLLTVTSDPGFSRGAARDCRGGWPWGGGCSGQQHILQMHHSDPELSEKESSRGSDEE